MAVRLWSLHPSYLDRQGLLACWREGLLAQAVLLGRTRGYTHHPQLERFRQPADPPALIGSYLHELAAEASRRGYRFDAGRIVRTSGSVERLIVTDGQLEFERRHLRAKIRQRNPGDRDRLAALENPTVRPHPVFDVIPGPTASWERGS